MSKQVYTQVMSAIESGTKVTKADLEVATAYAKSAKRKQPKGAVLDEGKRVYERQSGVCSGNDEGVACDRDAKTRGLCMKHYVRKYRTNPVNAEKARQASRNYAAKQRAAKELANA